jgi:hypothetical protein
MGVILMTALLDDERENDATRIKPITPTTSIELQISCNDEAIFLISTTLESSFMKRSAEV